ncbi:MAG: DUF2802 domain-containing protein [Dechloromonas sp.]|nr:DUF2802 domain-containing protein [Dechloromonas sp.]
MSLGAREIVLGLVVLLGLYMLRVLWRMRRLTSSAGTESPVAEPLLAVDRGAADKTSPGTAGETAWEAPPTSLAAEVIAGALEREIEALRNEVDAIRGELAALRQDLQQEMAHVRATQSVSPIYGDAMQMAVAGYDAVMISERCGIARAEAELVVALARSQENAHGHD